MVLLAFAAVSVAKRIKFTNCGPSVIDYVDISPCDVEPCKFKQNDTIHIEGAGSSNSEAKKPIIKVVVDLDDVPVEVPGIDPDACKLIECPLEKGKAYTIKYDFLVEDFFPSLTSNLTVTVTGDTEEDVVLCLKTEITIEN